MQSRLLMSSILSLVVGFSAGCKEDDDPAEPSIAQPTQSGQCAAGSSSMVESELVFGLDRKGQLIPEAQWQDFVDTTVTPVFPEGLSIFDIKGQYRMSNGSIVKEPSKLVLIYHDGSSENSGKLESLRAKYKERFEQESVLRTDDTICVSF